MDNFRFRASTPDGQQVSGQITARDQRDAIERLRSRNLLPIEAVLAKPRKSVLRQNRGTRKQARITESLRELATLVGAAQPVERSLEMVVESSDNKQVSTLFARLCSAVRSGSDLSEAMSQEEHYFTAIDASIVRSGEMAGQLGKALDELATMRERRAHLSRKVNSALIYPTVLAFTAIGAVIILLTVVIPEFRTLFEGRENLLPTDARMVFALSEWLTSINLIQFVVILGAILLVAQLRYLSPLRRVFSAITSRLPLISSFIKVRNSAELCRMLGALRGGGVTLPTALELSQEGLSSAAARAAMPDVVARVREGTTLSDALKRASFLEPMAERLIRAGEQSGELDAMLRRVASIFEDKLETLMMRIVAILEPALVLIMGVLAGSIVLSVMSAVISVNQLTG